MDRVPFLALLVVAIVVNGWLSLGAEAVGWSGTGALVNEVSTTTSVLQYAINAVLVTWGVVLAWGQGRLRQRRILLLGSDADAVALFNAVREHGRRRFQVAGFFDPTARSSRQLDLPVWGQAESLTQVVRQQRVRQVVVTRPCVHSALPMTELLGCRMGGTQVVDYHEFHETLYRRLPLTGLLACHLVFANGFHKGWTTRVVKRAWELLVTALLLPLCLPLFAVVAIAIKLESPGPVFYRQERLGINGRPYTVWKFRSMYADAEKDGPRLAVENDHRITRVGYWLRRLRIDELPQLLNVLAGHMSLIGPRPERSCFAEELVSEIPFYAYRTAVKPGITGWAQVNADYAMTLDEHREKLEYDLYYIKNFGFWLDLKILVATVGVVLCGRGR
ncbi:MAG TPA: exopolysaccharide biosynthesis polyprenyl glycosylphosphotransferase [bacterium]|jgi:exopolysaccharide biosynthesis polyprenyl glycosylphosphotransferase